MVMVWCSVPYWDTKLCKIMGKFTVLLTMKRFLTFDYKHLQVTLLHKVKGGFKILQNLNNASLECYIKYTISVPIRVHCPN